MWDVVEVISGSGAVLPLAAAAVVLVTLIAGFGMLGTETHHRRAVTILRAIRGSAHDDASPPDSSPASPTPSDPPQVR